MLAVQFKIVRSSAGLCPPFELLPSNLSVRNEIHPNHRSFIDRFRYEQHQVLVRSLPADRIADRFDQVGDLRNAELRIALVDRYAHKAADYRFFQALQINPGLQLVEVHLQIQNVGQLNRIVKLISEAGRLLVVGSNWRLLAREAVAFARFALTVVVSIIPFPSRLRLILAWLINAEELDQQVVASVWLRVELFLELGRF